MKIITKFFVDKDDPPDASESGTELNLGEPTTSCPNTTSSEGCVEGAILLEGRWVGAAVVGAEDTVGDEEGMSLLVTVGTDDGTNDGVAEGSLLGCKLGCPVGLIEGASEGAADGSDEGVGVGGELGLFDGTWLGLLLGLLDGTDVGALEGLMDTEGTSE
mmetsp:Transcript_27568/g.55631  ORF Transcript_27568/g.55631 Transcript_27568/m.55631 type:complete len:160 (-) Transcript_27568:797-1276(-)